MPQRHDDRAEEESRALGYETRDIKIRVVALFGLGLAVAMIAVLFLMSSLFDLFERRAERIEPPPRSLVAVAPAPAGIRGEVESGEELRASRAFEDSVLTAYGWVDPESNLVRVPIDRAIEIVAAKGLPARETSP